MCRLHYCICPRLSQQRNIFFNCAILTIFFDILITCLRPILMCTDKHEGIGLYCIKFMCVVPCEMCVAVLLWCFREMNVVEHIAISRQCTQMQILCTLSWYRNVRLCLCGLICMLLTNWTALLGTKERFEHCCLFGLCSRSGGNSCIITLL